MTKTKKSAADIFPVVESYLASELTQKEFSAEHGTSVAVLNYWLVKYRRSSTESE